MELIRISERKLKVMLSPDDMVHYAISCESMDYENTETRRAFWDILDIAKHQTGFDAARDKIYVQVYPSRSGGCELYVTMLPEEAKQRADNAEITKRQFSIYQFDAFATLVTVCAILVAQGYVDESDAYRVADRWFLRLRDTQQGTSGKPTLLYPFLLEYATREDGLLPLAYIREHGTCVCRAQAVQMLSRLA